MEVTKDFYTNKEQSKVLSKSPAEKVPFYYTVLKPKIHRSDSLYTVRFNSGSSYTS